MLRSCLNLAYSAGLMPSMLDWTVLSFKFKLTHKYNKYDFNFNFMRSVAKIIDENIFNLQPNCYIA